MRTFWLAVLIAFAMVGVGHSASFTAELDAVRSELEGEGLQPDEIAAIRKVSVGISVNKLCGPDYMSDNRLSGLIASTSAESGIPDQSLISRAALFSVIEIKRGRRDPVFAGRYCREAEVLRR